MKTTVLLETMAGKGSEIGGTFEELREIIDRVGCRDKIGVCFDTCHTWDAGYDIVNILETPNDEEGYIEEIHTVLQWTEKQNQQM